MGVELFIIKIQEEIGLKILLMKESLKQLAH